MGDYIREVETGKIAVGDFDKGKLEYLVVHDYGKQNNIKADFLGLTKDIEGVDHTTLMPLHEKMVATISTQYGCSMDCKFCDVPRVGKGINASYEDLKNQIIRAINLYPDIGATKRFNLHYARMGEPTFNFNVLEVTFDLLKIIRPYIGRSFTHPVVSTMMPKNNKKLMEFLNIWTIDLKNEIFRGSAGLQLSINSTDDKQREWLFSGNSLSLEEVAEIGRHLIDPVGRKYTLNFALSDTSIIDASKLKKMFNPNKFIVKITPLHNTTACNENDLKTSKGYTSFTPYQKVEEELKNEGFDVIVFIPSFEEESGKITCGNLILSEGL